MATQRTRQDRIWSEGASINDALAPGDHDANAVSIADTFNFVCSQLADMLGEVNWSDAPDLSIAAMAAKTWMDDYLALRDFLHLGADITVPPAVNGTGDTIGGAAPTMTLTDAAATFTVDMVKRNITISGATTGSNNGTFPIVGFTSTSVISYTNASGVAEAFTTGTWAVAGANFVVLDDSASEAPSRDVAIVSTTKGAVCAEIGAGDLGSNQLDEVTGVNALNPHNLCIIMDAATGDPIKSSNRQVYALLQVEDGAVDGDPFDDVDNQGQLSFVRPNAAYDDLEACPIADIESLDIIYAYADREALSLWDPSDFRRSSVLVDLAAAGVSITMDLAYDGGSQVAVDNTDVDFRLTDTKHFYLSDSTGASRILDVHAEAAGDEIDIAAAGGINVSTGDLTMPSSKATVNGVEVGGAAGRVATLSGDLDLRGADDISFVTVRETTPLPLDDATAGKISALEGGPHASVSAAIKYAIAHGMDFNLGVFAVSAGPYTKGTNIPAATGGVSLASPHSLDMNTVSGVDTFVFLNGRLQWGGNVTTKNDVYVGDTPASGDLKFDHNGAILNGDVIITLQLTAA